MTNILEIKNLEKNYHTQLGEIKAVDNFSFNLSNGEFVAIVGPSGCGKSTILSILAGIEEKSAGVFVFKNNLTIGYMLQQDSLFDWLTIYENCLIGLKIQNKLNDESKAYVKKLLETYGLKEFINNYPNNLSGGMRQRVALIRTLATKPDLLLMDEPYSALDSQTRLTVSNDVFNIIKKENKTVILVTHDIAEAVSMADRIIVLNKRPATIKKIYNIDLPNKTNPIKNRTNENFQFYYDSIWKDIDNND